MTETDVPAPNDVDNILLVGSVDDDSVRLSVAGRSTDHARQIDTHLDEISAS